MLTLPAPSLPGPLLPASSLPASSLPGADAPPPLPPAPADAMPAVDGFADLIALTAVEGDDAPAPEALMLDAPPAPPEPPPSAQPWALALVPELANLPALVVADPAEGGVEGVAPWPRRALPGLVPDAARPMPRAVPGAVPRAVPSAANWQATLPAITAPPSAAPPSTAPPSTAPVSPIPATDEPFWPEPASPTLVMPARIQPDPGAIPALADPPATMVNPPPTLVNAVQPLPANAPLPGRAPRREEVSETGVMGDPGPAIAAPVQPLATQAAPLATRTAAPLPPAAPSEPAPGPAIAIASDRLGEVAVRLNGSAENLQVSLQAQPAAAVLIGAETQRLQQDMANAGVSLSALSINGQRADLGTGQQGQQGRQRPQPRRDAVIAATRLPPDHTTTTADRFA